MKTILLMHKLQMEKKEFITSDELKEYCKRGNYDMVIKSLERSKYLTRIFRGIYYVKTPDEIILGKSKYNNLELVAKGLELKKIENWYYGLYTALKFNNMTHETFVIDDVINDTISRQGPMKINNHKFNFTKISKKLLNFGIKKQGKIRYSDPEKTILDFIYLGKQNGKSNRRIISDVSDWSKNISENKFKKYLKNYPKTIREIGEEIFMREDLIDAVSEKFGVLEKGLLEKDIILHEILSKLADDDYFVENYVFKGGTCLVKSYLGYYRFSEDLDFTWKDQSVFEGQSHNGIYKQSSLEAEKLGKIIEEISKEFGLEFKNEKGNDEYFQFGGGKMLTIFVWYQ